MTILSGSWKGKNPHQITQNIHLPFGESNGMPLQMHISMLTKNDQAIYTKYMDLQP